MVHKGWAGGNSYAKLKIGYLYANGLMGLGKDKNKATGCLQGLLKIGTILIGLQELRYAIWVLSPMEDWVIQK